MALPFRYYITYITIIIGGTIFFVLGLFKKIPDFKCIFNETFGISCPSCGLTRSLDLLFNGNIGASFKMHPFGIFFAAAAVAAMCLSAYGLIKSSRLEFFFGKKITIIAIAFVIIYLVRWVIALCE